MSPRVERVVTVTVDARDPYERIRQLEAEVAALRAVLRLRGAGFRADDARLAAMQGYAAINAG